MEFDGFKIGRQICACVFEPSQHQLDPSNPYRRNPGYGRYMADRQSAEGWIIPGQKPERYYCQISVIKLDPEAKILATNNDMYST